MKTAYYLFFILILAAACNNGQQEKETVSEKPYMPNWDTSAAFFIDSLVDEYELDTTFIPRYKRQYEGLLLLARGYHGDEIDSVLRNASWCELYPKEGGYFLDSTEVSFKTIFDGIVDEDSSEMTGVGVTGKNENGILMAKLAGLEPGEVEHIELDTNFVMPGTNMFFDFNNVHYRFYATAYYRIPEGRDYIDYIANYKLYLEKDSAGVKTKQLILARPFFGGTYLIGNFLFIGDIDRDGKPDFVLETSNNYNISAPTLYLSGYADEGELVKPVAYHASTGC